MPDFIPDSDTQFTAWVNNFVTYVNANLADLGLVAGDMTPVNTAQTSWNTGYSAHVTAQAAAVSAGQTKDAGRVTLESAIRVVVRKMRGSGQVSDSEAAAAGLTVRDTIRTAVAAPTTAPIGKVDTSQRLRHAVSFADASTPAGKAKPNGVLGCEVWIKIGGAAPADPSELTFLATDTKTPYTRLFNGEDGGKTAHYMLRWVSTRAEHGPWSETVSATITG